MAELDEKLKSLLSDEEGLKKVLEAAGALLGQNHAEEAPQPPQPAPAEQSPAPEAQTAPAQHASEPIAFPALPASPAAEKPDLNQLLGSLLGGLGGGNSSTSGNSDTGSPSGGDSGGQNPMSGMLPQLLQTFTGKSNYIDENRLNLVKAMKPYLAEAKAGNIDRAIKMANMAKAAKKALGLLGR